MVSQVQVHRSHVIKLRAAVKKIRILIKNNRHPRRVRSQQFRETLHCNPTETTIWRKKQRQGRNHPAVVEANRDLSIYLCKINWTSRTACNFLFLRNHRLTRQEGSSSWDSSIYSNAKELLRKLFLVIQKWILSEGLTKLLPASIRL